MKKYDKSLLIQIITIIICIVFTALILITPSFFDFSWNQLLRDTLPGTEYFFRFITEFGGTLVYLAIFFIIFWGINKNIAKGLLFIYVSSNFVNFYAKALIANERPPESNWILISASHLSTPSGHAMSSTVFWGYTAMKFKNYAMWFLSAVVVFLVGMSRIYLGVHWLGDVFTGWLFGLIILLLVWILEEPIRNFVSKQNIFLIYLGLALVGLIMMILTEILYDSIYDFGTPGGQMIGLALGFALEEKFVNFEIQDDIGKKWKLILRILIGILLIAVVYLGIYLIIDTNIFWMNALHYGITLILGIFIWPLLFKKIGI